MNEEHAEVDLAGAYVLDALTEGEARAFELHLRSCPACRSEVQELRQVADILPLAVAPVDPPAGLRGRILAEVRELEAVPPLTIVPAEASVSSTAARHSRWRQPMIWLGGVAAAVIIGLGAWNVSLQQQVHSHPAQSVVADELAHGARAWPVAGTAIAPSAAGTLVQPRQGGNALFVFTGLPASPANKVYQIWLMRGNQPTSGGTFAVSAAGTQVFHLLHPATGFQLTAVTVEPGPHGSAGPTTKAVLFGKLGA